MSAITFTVPGEPGTVEQETWKPVKGFVGEYEVSNLGRVRSLDRTQHRYNGRTDCDFKIKGRLLKPYLTGKDDGYCTVSLKHKNYKVHRLVAEAFLRKVEGKNEINHINGNKHDNAASNLEWVTNAENGFHALATGLKRSGESVKNAKLSASDVLQIRSTYIKGDDVFGAKPLSRAYGVSDTTIRRIVNHKKWRFESNDD